MSDPVIPLKELFEQMQQAAKASAREFERLQVEKLVTRDECAEYLNRGHHAEKFASHALLEEQQKILIHQLQTRIPNDHGFQIVRKGASNNYHISGHVNGESVTYDATNIHEAPDNLAPPVFKPPTHPEPSEAATQKRTWTQSFGAKKEAVKGWAQEHRILGGLASVTSIVTGGTMLVDGFQRTRKGLGFDIDKDGVALEAKSGSIMQTVAGGAEMLAGAGLATVGAYTGLVAIKGKGPISRTQ